MIHFGEETWVDDLLEAISKRVVDKSGLTSDRVFDTLAGDEDHIQFPPADQFVTVTPQRFPMDQPTFSGAGRYLCGFNGSIRVALLCRFAVDQELRDARTLRDKSRGILRVFLKVMDSLQGFNPPGPNREGDGQKTCILREPMRSDGFDVQPRRIKQGSPWVVISSTWQVRFSARLPGGNTPTNT